MKLSRLLLIQSWVLAVLFLAVHFMGVFPDRPIADPQLIYVVNLICVVEAIAGVYFACRFFRFERVKHYLDKEPREQRLEKMQLVRTGIISCAIITTAIFTLLAPPSTPFYCCLITLLGSVLCWPRKETR